MATAVLALGGCCVSPAQPSSWSLAVAHAANESPDARIVVLDIASGRLLASSDLSALGRTLAAPGSTLKPLVLYSQSAAGRWNPSRRIACDRRLTIDGRSLNCSHPPADPMDARQALAWSCNTYFAALGDSIAPDELQPILAETGILGQTGLATAEVTAEFHRPHTADEVRLALLGVDGIRVTPLELASAYRWLAVQMAAHPDSTATQTIQAGLKDSASFGIAAAASLGGVAVMGKTGTANQGQGTPSHGWFVGLVPAAKPTAVVAVFLPAGHGANAAQVAAGVLSRSPLKVPAHAR